MWQLKTYFLWSCLIVICSGGAVAVAEAGETLPGQPADSDTELFCPPNVVTDLLCIDCFTVGFCDGKGQSVLRPCPAATPYCNNNVCSAQRDLTWDVCDEQILDQQLSCSSEGFFPDPFNCHQYHFCPDPQVKPVQLRTTFECPANYVYDSANYNCKKTHLAKNCVTMECTTPNTFVTYPGNANYYGFCKSAGTVPVVFKCPPGHNFNLKTFGCEFICAKEGHFVGPKCRQYYICYKSGTQLVARLETCPINYLWSPTTKTCEKDTTGQCTST